MNDAPGMVGHTYNLSYLWGRERNLKLKTSLWEGSETLSQKQNKKKRKKMNGVEFLE
jgi:hypothetical protein